MNKIQVRFIAESKDGLHMNASCGRLSTMPGGAIDIFENKGDAESDLKLVKKIAASGHMAALEHHVMTVAFDGVSVCFEQFLIEHRLASYMVKSRRYVDFAGAGYVLPEGADAEYERTMGELFQAYSRLEEMGVPREDARFVLPYSFRSQIYMTANARVLLRLAAETTRGRGAIYPEFRAIGARLAEELEARYPGLIAMERVETGRDARELDVSSGSEVSASVEITDKPVDALKTLRAALEFSGRSMSPRELARDARPREFECLNYNYKITNISLASLTHLTRHRMISLIARDSAFAAARGNYIVPESVKAKPEALEIYLNAFKAANEYARRRADLASYLALAGNTTDALVGMNAREILHFLKLRMCERAQWEIRDVASELKNLLCADCPEIFFYMGPACRVEGRCPEGRLSCKKPYKPVIGLVPNRNDNGEEYLPRTYVSGIERAGGRMIEIPFNAPKSVVDAIINCVDGVLLSGGTDVDPRLYGETPRPETDEPFIARDEMELHLFKRAFERGIPIFGICRGNQIINVALGGTICQHVPDEYGAVHYVPGGVFHNTRILPGTYLHELFGADEIETNSYHHQSIKRLADGLRQTAECEGVIEGAEWIGDGRFLRSVQWHPERTLDRDEYSLKLFSEFVEACK